MRRFLIAPVVVAAALVLAGCGDRQAEADHSAHSAIAMRSDHATHSGQSEANVASTPVTRYRCPMHPEFVRDEPGSCGICGMTLVPFVFNPNEGRSAVGGLAVVKMDEAERRRIGVRIAEAKRLPLTKRIRTVGRIAADERRVTHIHTKASGWVEKLYVDYTGQAVRRGGPVLDIYSPEIVAAQQEYLVAYRTRSAQPELVRLARQRLALLDLTDAQIARLEATGVPQTTLTIFAPHDGTVIDKLVSAGHQVSPEMILYSIADLSRVWVLADAYEADLPLVRVGQEARVSVPSGDGEAMTGRVTFVSPVVDLATRTAPVRIEFANPHGGLRPGAFVDVELDAPLGTRLVIPRESILDSGTRKVVFVETPSGEFNPRQVRLGVGSDGLVEVLDGVTVGEHVVSGATFFIDSESQLRAAMSAMVSHQH